MWTRSARYIRLHLHSNRETNHQGRTPHRPETAHTGRKPKLVKTITDSAAVQSCEPGEQLRPRDLRHRYLGTAHHHPSRRPPADSEQPTTTTAEGASPGRLCK